MFTALRTVDVWHFIMRAMSGRGTLRLLRNRIGALLRDIPVLFPILILRQLEGGQRRYWVFAMNIHTNWPRRIFVVRWRSSFG